MPKLVNYLLETNHDIYCSKQFCIACMFMDMFRSQSNVFVPIDFHNNVKRICPYMETGTQQDAHEYLMNLLDTLDMDLSQVFDKIEGVDSRTNIVRTPVRRIIE
eukprot:342131_1